MANTDERLKETFELNKDAAESGGNKATDYYIDGVLKNLVFTAAKAIEARDALRIIRDACNPEQPFNRTISRDVLKAVVERINKVLED